MSALAAVMLGPAACPAPRAALSAETMEVLAGLGDRLAREVSSDGIGSISVAVIVDGRIAYTHGVGCADCEKGIPATPQSIYRVGSVSKMITGTVLGLLVEEGTVALDDPVANYVPEIAELMDPDDNSRVVTFRHLANHTSGLAREPRTRSASRGPIRLWEQKVLGAIPDTRRKGVPGTRYRYSNIGYAILGLAMSRAAGKPFMKLVEAELFRPLKMTSTTFILSPSRKRLLAKGYDNSDGDIDTQKPAREHGGRGYKVPNGGVYSSVVDLAHYVIALMGGSEHLADPLLTRLHERPPGIVSENGRGPEAYGLGIRMRVDASGNILSANHGGTVSGYRTWIQFHPVEGHGIVLLRNYNRGANELSTIADEFLADLDESLK